ncbi:MAG: ABC transporter ATP-binding protein [Alistipes sp.]|nr:ABC transporter ATP-binding protein [Alistipes sp.]
MKYLRWINGMARPQRGALSVMMLCHVMLAACAVGFVYVSKRLVDAAVSVLAGCQTEDLWIFGTLMAAIVLLRIGLNALRSYLQIKTEISLKNRLRRRLFDILLRVHSDGGSRRHTGDVLNRLQEDVRVVSILVILTVLPSISFLTVTCCADSVPANSRANTKSCNRFISYTFI